MQRLVSTEFGAILMIPYLCTWDMTDHRGFWDSLSRLTLRTLRAIHLGLQTIGKMDDTVITFEVKEECNMTLEKRHDYAIRLMNEICDSPLLWSRVILYRTNTQNGSRVRGALPAPPYWSQIPINDETDDTTEGDLSGPFPFVYYPILEAKLDGDLPSIDCSLVYVNPNRTPWKNGIPTIDFVPPYSVPNRQLRCIRYAALLVDEIGGAPSFAIEAVKTMYANFVHQMHLVRQKKLEVDDTNTSMNAKIQNPVDTLSLLRSNHSTKLPQKVYTDSNDPMELGNPECGLARDKFVIVHDPNEADIIFSYKSLFSPGPLREIWQTKIDRQILINQFPYEGALVQKDHLGREICRQHGLPLPSWALETYDLDVQLGEFVGASLCEADRSGGTLPLWIIKPSRGTQSQGHVITRNLGQVLRLVDACGGSRVAQRYIVRDKLVSSIFYSLYSYLSYTTFPRLNTIPIGKSSMLSRKEG
jgi:Tubulin-tyrosine ligase family